MTGKALTSAACAPGTSRCICERLSAFHERGEIATAALGTPMGLAELGLADLAVGGKAGFVVWSALLGAGAGRIIAVWRTKRHKRRGSSRCGP